MVFDKALLTDEEKQRIILDAPDLARLSEVVSDVSLVARALRLAHDQGVPGTSDLAKAASMAKQHGKVCVGVEYTLRRLVRELPNDASKIPEHARNILAKLSSKGIKLPPGLSDALHRLVKTAKSAEATAPPDCA